MKIKKIGILMIAGTLMCTSPAATVMASDATETVQEIITDNEIDSLVSDPDKVVDIIMYAKDKVQSRIFPMSRLEKSFRQERRLQELHLQKRKK